LNDLISIVGVIALSSVHVFADRLRLLGEARHSVWISFSGGGAIAYVFVYILPKLSDKQLVLAGVASEHPILDYLHHHAYLVALAGLTAYFGVALVAERLEETTDKQKPIETTRKRLESIHIAGFAAYSLLVGYLFADLPRSGVLPFTLFTAIMCLHFVGRDHVLAERYGALYHRAIRWMFVAAALVGWVIGAATTVPPATVALWFAFLAGSITLNAIEEELPRGHHGRFWPFVGGAALFTALILLLERFPKLDPIPM
jgi:hypothetical protein